MFQEEDFFTHDPFRQVRWSCSDIVRFILFEKCLKKIVILQDFYCKYLISEYFFLSNLFEHIFLYLQIVYLLLLSLANRIIIKRKQF